MISAARKVGRVVMTCMMALAAVGGMVAEASVLKVVDAADGAVIGGVSIFSANERNLGLTTSEGALPESVRLLPADYPLTLRCAGYLPTTVDAGIVEVAMQPLERLLPEVNVDAESRQILHLICYAREYLGGEMPGDTIFSFGEYVIDYLIPLRKMKKFKKEGGRILASRVYARNFNSSRDTSYISERADMGLDFVSYCTPTLDPLPIPEEIRQGGFRYGENGKYWPAKSYLRRGGRLTVVDDALADTKEHSMSPGVLKLIGATMDIVQLETNRVYEIREEASVCDVRDLVSETLKMKMKGRGKMLKRLMHVKEDIDLDCFVELYPMEAEYLTEEEAREVRQSTPSAQIVTPSGVPALPAAVQRLIDSCAGS